MTRICFTARGLMILGIISSVGMAYLGETGSLLNGIELPTFFETTTIRLPDGGRLTATIPTARLQRDGPDGQFRNGWFVDAHGGRFGIGLTEDDRIVVCTGRGREIWLFDLDGHPIGHQVCFRAPHNVADRLLPDDFPEGDLRLRYPRVVTFRVLFTRGIKGGFVYFMDEGTRRLFRSRTEQG